MIQINNNMETKILPPNGYRFLEVGEITLPGDMGYMVWGKNDKHRGWFELKSGHVLYQMIVTKGRTARLIEK